MDSLISDFKSQIEDLEDLLVKHKIQETEHYKLWQSDFTRIYNEKSANVTLYTLSALLYVISIFFINNYVIKDEDKIDFNEEGIENLSDVEKSIEDIYSNIKIFELAYFEPILHIFQKDDLDYLSYQFSTIFDSIIEYVQFPEYIFDFFIQKLISPLIRHKTGEFYTPPFLVKEMVKETYTIGDVVLDPCCGTGNFLIEIIKVIRSSNIKEPQKLKAINNLNGSDINPFSLYITKINILYLIKSFLPEIKINLIITDSLFPNNGNSKDSFDLIIGNPPWYTYADIESIKYQNKIKGLAEHLEIKPLPKNILNIEISTIFFYKFKENLKKNAKIFFVMTKGVINGSHTSRFRNFKGFTNVTLWTFDKSIEKVFNIDFVCLLAQKSENSLNFYNKEIPRIHFTLKKNLKSIDYFDDVELSLESEDILVPYNIEKKNGKTFTKKLVTKEQFKDLLPIQKSAYKSLFHKGADLNPRNLIFVSAERINENEALINPDERIFKKAKAPWNKKEFSDEIVNHDNIFKVIKSTELVKFNIFDSYEAFLPISNKSFFSVLEIPFSEREIRIIQDKSLEFYNKINKIYITKKKSTTKHKTLLENLDRWSKLINDRQSALIKVVYNNSGSIINAAIIEGQYIVTGDLSFYATQDIQEAYYLTAILNSNLLTNHIKIVRSSRHIFKLPLDVPIKKFNKDNPNHQKLAELGSKCHKLTNDVIEKISESKSKIEIQKELKIKLENFLNKIDILLENELKT